MYTIEELTATQSNKIIHTLQSHFQDKGDIRYAIEISVGKTSSKHAAWKKLNNISKSKYWLLLHKSSIAGIIGYYTKYGQDDCLWIGWFYVKPKYRSYGFGRTLLSFIISIAKFLNKRYARLYTNTGNKKAHILYEKLGFKIYRKNDNLKYLELELFYKE